MGEELAPDTYKFLQKTREPENLKKEGYYIEGYYKDKNFTERYTFGKSIWKSRTLYVNWQPGYALQLFFVEGEDDDDRNQVEKTGINEAYLKMLHEQYVKPDTTYTLPLIYNHVEGRHHGEQLLWYTNADAQGDPIDTKDFIMNQNIKLYGIWFDTSPSKFDITNDGTLRRYLGYCENIVLPKSVRKFKSIPYNDFMSGLWDTTTVGDGTNYSVFDKVISDLKRVFVNEECESLGGCAFRNCISLEQVYFAGNKITTIDDYAFAYCEKLYNLALPTSTTNIGYRAFYNSSIRTLENTQNITTIDAGAFINCLRLETIVFDKVTTINQMAFAGCYSLKSLYLKTNQVVATNVTSSENNILYSSTSVKLYVPSNLVEIYKSAYPWNAYSTRILAIPE